MTFSEIFTWLQWFNKPSTFYQDLFNEEPSTDQAAFLNDLPNQLKNRMLICAPGGCGKTKALGVAALWHPTVMAKYLRRPVPTIIISGSLEQSNILYEYSKIGLSHPLIKNMIKGEPLKTKTEFLTTSFLKALPKSFKAIYGQHVPVVIVDEASINLEMDAVINDTYRIVSGQIDNRIILSSTPTTFMSKFVDMWENRGNVAADWIRYAWSKSNCQWIPDLPKEIEEARKNLPADQFSIFWEGKPFPLIGTLIPQDDLKLCFPGSKSFRYNPNGNAPVMGIDWGYVNPTVITIRQRFNDIDYILFSKEYAKKKFKRVQEWIAYYYDAYHCGRLYADAADIGENQRLQSEHSLPVKPIAFKAEKAMMKSYMKARFEEHKVQVPEEFDELKRQLQRYTWETNKEDDYVDSLMLSLKEPGGYNRPKLWWKVLGPEKPSELESSF